MKRNTTYTINREEHWTKPGREDYPVPIQLNRAIINDPLIKLPLKKKEYDVLLHTVKKIREHGGQFEVLLKVKQADVNPDFDFLNIDSVYHALYAYLKGLDHESFWNIYLSKPDPKSQLVSTALSMLESYADEEEESVNNPSTKLVDDLLADLDDEGDIKVNDPSKPIIMSNSDDEKKKNRLERAKLLLRLQPIQLESNDHDQKRIKISSEP